MPCYNRLIVDLDGVLWRGSKLIEGNVKALSHLAREGARIVFLTNNSTKSRRSYAMRITEILGVRVGEDQVVNSGYSAATWLKRNHGCLKVLPVGGVGLVEELVKACHLPLEPEEWYRAEAVVVGLDRSVTYSKLAMAHRAITRGALFVATNTDKSYPVEDATEPGAGALVEFLKASTGVEPVVDTGKPGEWILRLALERLGDGEPLVVGDRPDTDIRMALKAGLPALLVLTGVTREPPKDLPPGVGVVRDLGEARVTGSSICV
ncbi:MAG: HAD-IIA family hydrolase [Desulfurococcales archaeon]|nr:HAD-IIA family hydrolase [Desulfurococcales archaeon]